VRQSHACLRDCVSLHHPGVSSTSIKEVKDFRRGKRRGKRRPFFESINLSPRVSLVRPRGHSNRGCGEGGKGEEGGGQINKVAQTILRGKTPPAWSSTPRKGEKKKKRGGGFTVAAFFCLLIHYSPRWDSATRLRQRGAGKKERKKKKRGDGRGRAGCFSYVSPLVRIPLPRPAAKKKHEKRLSRLISPSCSTSPEKGKKEGREGTHALKSAIFLALFSLRGAAIHEENKGGGVGGVFAAFSFGEVGGGACRRGALRERGKRRKEKKKGGKKEGESPQARLAVN